MSASRAERFGSYSIAVTFPGIPNLLRRKSTFRYMRLWPPPRYRVVTWPWLLRPPCERNGSRSDSSGAFFVISAKSENGTEKRGNIWREVAGQISDHVDLATLELRYEAEHAGKKLLAAAIMFLFVLTGFIVLQVALVGALMKLGLSLGVSALILSGVYFVMAVLVYMALARRDKRVGPPFSATQRELHETMRWIQKILS